MEAFHQEKVDNVLQNVTAGYNGFSINRQWEIPQLLLQLQELTTCDKSQSNFLHNLNGLSMVAPTHHDLLCQPKNRLKPVCELAAIKATKKLTSSLQKEGISQLLVGQQNDIMVNGEPSARHCHFFLMNMGTLPVDRFSSKVT